MSSIMAKGEGALAWMNGEEGKATIVAALPELKKRFNFTSMLAVCVTLMATWEASGAVFAGGLVAGGPVSLLYGYILALFGTIMTCLSLAELASAYPTSGGQYHWTAELAPARFSAFLSWTTGWITVLGWQALTASAAFLGGTMLQGLLVLNYPDYVFQRWHGTMLYWAILLIAYFFNTVAIKALPLIENMVLVFHVATFFAILIPLVVLSPHGSAEYVFTTFENNSGWSSDGVAWCIGLLSATYVLIGYDGASHLSEEMQNARLLVPYAMIGTIVLNGLLGFAFLLALLFCLGDVTSVLETATGFPIIQIFYNTTGSAAAASAMTSPILVMAITSTFGLLASASRTLWAFARDQGTPFSGHLSKIHKSSLIPLHSISWSVVFLVLLGFINIGSSTAFNAIISLAVVGLYISYLIPIMLHVVRRVSGPPISYGPFSLGKFGLPINILAICYSILISVFLFFPPYQPVTAENMNYASLVFGGVVLFAIFWWFVRGRNTYVSPARRGDSSASVTE